MPDCQLPQRTGASAWRWPPTRTSHNSIPINYWGSPRSATPRTPGCATWHGATVVQSPVNILQNIMVHGDVAVNIPWHVRVHRSHNIAGPVCQSS